QQLLRLHGRRLAEPPLCTAALARRLLEGRVRRVGLASLAHFFGVSTRPCHRALPDAEATAEVLVHLIALAQELGARRLSDLRARLRSYFRSERQRPSVEAALTALDRIEWRVLGSELEAALEELRLIRELQPPANSRSRRRDHGVYLRRKGDELVVSKHATEL